MGRIASSALATVRGAIAVSVGSAWATYRAIERPVRFGRPSIARIATLAGSMLVVGFFGYNGYQRNGLGYRYIEKRVSVVGFDGGDLGLFD